MFTDIPTYKDVIKYATMAIDIQKDFVNKSFQTVNKEMHTYNQKGLDFFNQISENAKQFITTGTIKEVSRDSNKD
jgi:soluble cytochrome b562